MRNLLTQFKATSLYRFFRNLEQATRKHIKIISLKRRLNKATPVFIYQMGKVASSSIHHSLKKQYPGAVAHAHHIGSDNSASELFYGWFNRGLTIKIISPVRDPIGYNISAFFQNFENITGTPYSQSKLTTDGSIQLFLDKVDHDIPLNWFDKNIKKYFGIDIYSDTSIDGDAKQYHRNNVSLLVFRIDIDDTKKEKVIRDFLDFPNFKLHNRNISSEKIYNNDYSVFKNSLKLPSSYLKRMGESKFFNHFYSQQEITNILSKWT